MAVERVLSNLNLISFKTEGGLQNHIDELQDGDLVFTPDSSLKGNLFDFKWTDHKLNDISWLNADTFSWQSGDVYVAAYEHLLNDYNSLPIGVLYAYYAEDAGETFYLRTDTPSVGDQLLDETGAPAYEAYGEHKVKEIYDDGSFARTATFPGNRYYRDTSKDITLSTPESKTETINGITITYYKAEDGHKICVQDNEANVQALYEATGVAWYYILDTANKQFKLPRTKFGFTGLRDSVGDYVEAGLPNITGTINNAMFLGNNGDAVPTGTGAFKVNSYNSQALYQGNTSNRTDSWAFDASRSNATYGNSDTVQPKATQMYLYFYVGNFEREAVEQTAGLNAEMFNDKADVSSLEYKANTDLSNLTTEGKKQLGPVCYRVAGLLINSVADTVQGHGVAEVYLYPNGFAKIEYSIKCTTSGSSTSYFQWGINSDLLTSKNPQIPKITPVGGTMTFYATNGNIAADRTGYGGILAAVSQFWQPGRVYTLEGDTGGWPAGNFLVNQRVVGTAWGTYEI